MSELIDCPVRFRFRCFCVCMRISCHNFPYGVFHMVCRTRGCLRCGPNPPYPINTAVCLSPLPAVSRWTPHRIHAALEPRLFLAPLPTAKRGTVARTYASSADLQRRRRKVLWRCRHRHRRGEMQKRGKKCRHLRRPGRAQRKIVQQPAIASCCIQANSLGRRSTDRTMTTGGHFLLLLLAADGSSE